MEMRRDREAPLTGGCLSKNHIYTQQRHFFTSTLPEELYRAKLSRSLVIGHFGQDAAKLFGALLVGGMDPVCLCPYGFIHTLLR